LEAPARGALAELEGAVKGHDLDLFGLGGRRLLPLGLGVGPARREGCGDNDDREGARGEWMLHATVHKLRKLATHRDKLPPKRFRGSTFDMLHHVGQALRRLASALTTTAATP
jgi:hypothetical protein